MNRSNSDGKRLSYENSHTVNGTVFFIIYYNFSFEMCLNLTNIYPISDTTYTEGFGLAISVKVKDTACLVTLL